jgi:hypothetical protein
MKAFNCPVSRINPVSVIDRRQRASAWGGDGQGGRFHATFRFFTALSLSLSAMPQSGNLSLSLIRNDRGKSWPSAHKLISVDASALGSEP